MMTKKDFAAITYKRLALLFWTTVLIGLFLLSLLTYSFISVWEFLIPVAFLAGMLTGRMTEQYYLEKDPANGRTNYKKGSM